LKVDWEGDAVRLSIPPPEDVNDLKNEPVPSIIDMQQDGTPRPVNYELADDDGEVNTASLPPPSSSEVL
jgi:hypothetical protein